MQLCGVCLYSSYFGHTAWCIKRCNKVNGETFYRYAKVLRLYVYIVPYCHRSFSRNGFLFTAKLDASNVLWGQLSLYYTHLSNPPMIPPSRLLRALLFQLVWDPFSSLDSMMTNDSWCKIIRFLGLFLSFSIDSYPIDHICCATMGSKQHASLHFNMLADRCYLCYLHTRTWDGYCALDHH